ncbi:stAR-related lipid transfer protein 3-like isoform X1 [Lingula anatina]|uniref:StAR-related lipid transfer protein 3-like isoform X1 n=1 Tax=Lingula anatina TaxID=7574 RepID=A0A1S3HQ04_LINAN|nr:stAR-related lipid transfer protein 3-like isoform X1 [Lingula anatina]|eukprot:XP_013387119.1 stAR-related lipid transfer protein 3-like isoform X1 [Lingula anatina]
MSYWKKTQESSFIRGNIYNASGDMGQREEVAQQAGRLLYHGSAPYNYNRPNSYANGGTAPTYGSTTLSSSVAYETNPCPCCKPMSTSRRAFCIMVTFDVLLLFVLWILYTQLSTYAGTFSKRFMKEVEGYDFKQSLFDIPLLSFWRFLVLIFSYAALNMRNPWLVALTTFGTCVFLLIKVFMFNFDEDLASGQNTLDYVLIIISFVVAWVECWFLDFRVLPEEKRAEIEARGAVLDERTSLLGRGDHRSIGGTETNDQYYSPYHTPHDSDDEEGSKRYHSIPPSSVNSRASSRNSNQLSLGSQEQEYQRLAGGLFATAMQLYENEEGWKLDNGDEKDLSSGCVYSKQLPELGGKFFKLKGVVNTTPQKGFEEIYFNTEDSPAWNPTVLESKILQVIDEHTDVLYNIAAEAAGGMVSARDFVNLRCWKEMNGMMISVSKGVTHPDMPEQKKYVRGENGPGCWVFKAVPGDPNKSEFVWIVNTNLKGWLPTYLIDQAMSGVLMDFFKYFNQRINYLNTLES